MNLTFAPRGIIQIDDARITYPNFAGARTQYNREGDRNFVLIIDEKEVADALIEEGWKVKIRPPREEGDDPFMYMPVKVKFNDRGPAIYLNSGDNQVRLDEESVSCLDNIEILSVDLDIRPYDWEVNGATGRTAYLQAMRVIQKVDRFVKTDDQF